MQYLESFRLASAMDEDSYLLSYPYQLEMQCFSHNNVYPFKIFPPKQCPEFHFAPVTIFYGGNGSGKSTLLNVIAQKLRITRFSPFNNTPFMEAYLKLCRYSLAFGREVPRESRIITSDDVFDFLLDIRSINDGIERRREQLFEEYTQTRRELVQPLRSLEDYDELKRVNEAKRSTKSAYVSRRLPKELSGKSNGESAFVYFTNKIEDHALYLLDEPENSLSATLQNRLMQFIEESVRFYHCQFIISTHSPFLLSMKGARIYNLDAVPVAETRWTELENVRVFYDFFERHKKEFGP